MSDAWEAGKLLNVVDKRALKKIEIVFHSKLSPMGNNLQSKTLFLAFFYSYLSIVKSIFDCRLSGVITLVQKVADANMSLYGRPHFYTATRVYRGILFFLTFALKHRLWVLVRTRNPCFEQK